MKITIQSNNLSSTHMEEVLSKAVNQLQSQRENRPFEPELQQPVTELEKLVDKILDNMFQEIDEILDGENNAK